MGVSLDDKSTFNMGVAYLERLHNILKFINLNNIHHDYKAVYGAMKDFYKELSPLMSDEEQRKRIRGELTKIYNLLYHGRKQTNGLAVRLLDDVEEELRLIMHQRDLLIPKASDPRKALAGG